MQRCHQVWPCAVAACVIVVSHIMTKPPLVFAETVGLKRDDGADVAYVDERRVVTHLIVPGTASSHGASSQDGVSVPSMPGELYCTAEPGFPVQADHRAGSYHAGPAIHTLVGNIDADRQLEIIATGLANGPLYAWNHDGSPVNGWPVRGPKLQDGEAYPALGKLARRRLSRAFDVVVGFGGSPSPTSLAAYVGDGSLLGSAATANYVSTPAALANVVGNWRHEIFIGEEDWQLHGYDASGIPLSGWPVYGSPGGQERHTPAIADLDGDRDLEMVTASGSTTPGVQLFAYHHDGRSVQGFPLGLNPSYGYLDTFVAIGDLKGDGRNDMVVVVQGPAPDFRPEVLMFSRTSAGWIREWNAILAGRLAYGSAPALADLTGDGLPEIIVQTDGTLNVLSGSGTPIPPWPITWSTAHWLGNSAPVVGDINGDRKPEIVVTSQVAGSSMSGEVRIYSADGALLWNAALPIGAGAVPAIADIDRDRHNEVIVTGSSWDGTEGSKDKVWVFDCGGGGRIEWSQFGRDAMHRGFYPTRHAAADQ